MERYENWPRGRSPEFQIVHNRQTSHWQPQTRTGQFSTLIQNSNHVDINENFVNKTKDMRIFLFFSGADIILIETLIYYLIPLIFVLHLITFILFFYTNTTIMGRFSYLWFYFEFSWKFHRWFRKNTSIYNVVIWCSCLDWYNGSMVYRLVSKDFWSKKNSSNFRNTKLLSETIVQEN